MPLRNAVPLTWKPKGVSDAVDASNAFPGAMMQMTNLVPSPATADQWVPRPARDYLANFANSGLFAQATTVSGVYVFGDFVYGLVASMRNPGHDEPFVCNAISGGFGTVGGITRDNTPVTLATIGATQPALFAKVAGRILVTHQGFPGGTGNQPFVGSFNGNVHAGSATVTGLFRTTVTLQPGQLLTGPGIPANTYITSFPQSVDFSALGTGTAGSSSMTVSDTSQVVIGQSVVGPGVSGFVTSVSTGNITVSPPLSANMSGAVVNFHGDMVMISQPATATLDADFLSVTTTGSLGIKFGWFDVSGTSFTRTGDLNGTTTIANPSNLIGIEPGLLVTGAGIPAGTTVASVDPIGNTITLSAAATATATGVTLTFGGGTPAAPLWGAGDTAINPLPSVPLGVGSFNGRAYFACGANGIPFSDSLLPLLRSNANQALIPGNGLPVTHCVGQPLSTPITGGIIQALYAFQGAAAIQQITGDPTTANLQMNALNIATGTLGPGTIAPTTLGLIFVSPEGMRIIDFTGTISQPIGEAGTGVTLPFINVVDATRMAAAANGDVIRISAQNAQELTSPFHEWWFDIALQKWSGPHSLQTSHIAPYVNTFITAAIDVPGQLYKSPSTPSGLSDYEEDGQTLTWTAQTCLLPDTEALAQNAILEGTLGLTLPSDRAVNVTAFDELGAELDTVVIPGNFTMPVWGGPPVWGGGLWYGVKTFYRQFPLPWAKTLVFRQISFRMTSTSRFGVVLGNLRLRYQKLGYIAYDGPFVPQAPPFTPPPFLPPPPMPPEPPSEAYVFLNNLTSYNLADGVTVGQRVGIKDNLGTAQSVTPVIFGHIDGMNSFHGFNQNFMAFEFVWNGTDWSVF